VTRGGGGHGGLGRGRGGLGALDRLGGLGREADGEVGTELIDDQFSELVTTAQLVHLVTNCFVSDTHLAAVKEAHAVGTLGVDHRDAGAVSGVAGEPTTGRATVGVHAASGVFIAAFGACNEHEVTPGQGVTGGDDLRAITSPGATFGRAGVAVGGEDAVGFGRGADLGLFLGCGVGLLQGVREGLRGLGGLGSGHLFDRCRESGVVVVAGRRGLGRRGLGGRRDGGAVSGFAGSHGRKESVALIGLRSFRLFDPLSITKKGLEIPSRT